MEETKTKTSDEEQGMSFSDYMAQLDGSEDNFPTAEDGKMVDGIVVDVTGDTVFLDVGCKCEGAIPIAEFDIKPATGDKVQVFLEKTFGPDGSPIISKNKADARSLWEGIQQAFKEKTLVKGKVTGTVKGGFEVSLGGDIVAFLPSSQADIRKIDDPDKLVGLETSFSIERLYYDNKRNIVVNRRKYMEDDIDKKRDDFFKSVKIGDVLDGTVKSFTNFGAFVDLGGFDGLLHINDMSWGHVTKPGDYVKKGQTLKVKLIRIEPETKRINVSLKHLTEDPWIHFEDKYHINQIVEGKVTKFIDFGAFVTLEEGIEGLVHISEFSWTKKVEKPSDVLKIGDTVKCMILGYDIQAGRVSLGIKQVLENPWDKIEEKYPAGSTVKGKIVRITNNAAFVNLEEGIDAYLAADDISWLKHIKYPSSALKEGDEIEAKVLESNASNHRIKVGIKQLTENPWIKFTKEHKVGSVLEGEISSITDEFGVFVKTDCGIEGLINKANLSTDRAVSYEEAVKKYKVGDKIKVCITDISASREKVGFSVRELKRKEEREEISQYMASVDKESGGAYTLGDYISNAGDKKSDKATKASNKKDSVATKEVSKDTSDEKKVKKANKSTTTKDETDTSDKDGAEKAEKKTKAKKATATKKAE